MLKDSPMILAVEVPSPSCELERELVLTSLRPVTVTVQEYMPDSLGVVCVSITRVMSGYELFI